VLYKPEQPLIKNILAALKKTVYEKEIKGVFLIFDDTIQEIDSAV